MDEALSLKLAGQDNDGPSTMKLSLPMILRQNVPGYKARQSTQAQARRSAAGESRASTSASTETKFGRRKQRRHDNGERCGGHAYKSSTDITCPQITSLALSISLYLALPTISLQNSILVTLSQLLRPLPITIPVIPVRPPPRTQVLIHVLSSMTRAPLNSADFRYR